MNILFFTENFPPETNAAATRVHERAVYWVKWGHRVTVVTCNPNFPHGRLFDGYANSYGVEIMDGIRVVRARTYIAPNRGVLRRTADFLSYMVAGYLAARREPPPDVVVSTSPQFFAAVAAWWYAKRRSLHYVFELGDLWPASIAAVGAFSANLPLWLVEKLELRMYRDADSVVALTESFRDNLVARRIDPNKIAVVVNGVDLWRYDARPKDADLVATLDIGDAFVVGYIGTHGMAHALGNVLEAAARLADRPHLKFLLVGAGAERASLVENAKAQDLRNVCFLEPQPKERMPAVWSVCDVALVHLKNSEVFAGVIPSKIFEAMGMGLPILFAGPEGEASRIIAASGAGLCVAPENPDTLADAIITLASEPGMRRRLAEASVNAAPSHSRETQARRMLDVLERVVAGRGSEVSDIRSSGGAAK